MKQRREFCPFSSVHSLLRNAEPGAAARLDFDKYQHLLVRRNDVCLPKSTPPVSIEDPVAGLDKVLDGNVLTTCTKRQRRTLAGVTATR